MNTIEKIYTNYDGLLEEFSEEVIQSRYAVFYEEIEEFAKSLGIREKIQISESLLSHAVLDYFTDISRLKHFHQAKHINSLKVISYETYWLLRRKPIQILVEDVYGDSHPGSAHLDAVSRQAVYGVFEEGAFPAHLKAAARINIPTIFIPGGSMRPGPNQTTSLVAGDISLRQKRKNEITPEEIRNYKLTGCPSVGACTFLGTASTMQCMAEALGMALPGNALVPATMRDLTEYSRKAGKQVVRLAKAGITPSMIMTKEAFRNAIVVHSAIGGSTNALIHLPAIAKELGIELDPELFNEINRKIPHIGNVNPSGKHLTESFWFAGGIPMVQIMLKDHLDLDVLTVTGNHYATAELLSRNQFLSCP